MSIYIPDELKVRIDDAGDQLNWSGVAQAAFREAIAANNVKRTGNMDEAVERLRISKNRVESKDYDHGKACGRRWAMETAEYDELERVANFDGCNYVNMNNQVEPLIEVISRRIDPSQEHDLRDWRNFWEEMSGTSAHLRDRWARGFADGAGEVFDEVNDRL